MRGATNHDPRLTSCRCINLVVPDFTWVLRVLEISSPAQHPCPRKVRVDLAVPDTVLPARADYTIGTFDDNNFGVTQGLLLFLFTLHIRCCQRTCKTRLPCPCLWFQGLASSANGGETTACRTHARIFHTDPTATAAALDLEWLAAARRAPPHELNIVPTTPSLLLGPRPAPQRRLYALATDKYEISGLAVAGEFRRRHCGTTSRKF